ncbi:lysophospholipase L1-like esterase [Glaciihabitans tibetensis]|uniref:Lysophospholipase L1-like esterase n=2 Tax=Glaciihabitans tibetensis TaxID=1266600 RepID=A0A2T0V3A8_9MICO|nr:lysophospholipase L1-like esterase [Glaciihabitans tibetensis]
MTRSTARLSRRKLITLAVVLAALVLFGVAIAAPGGAAREAVAAVTKYRECFIAGGTSDNANATVGMGDSITAGNTNALVNVGANNSYFDILGCKDDSPITYVANLGIRRDTSAQVLARVPDAIALSPRQVLILAGANDIITGADSETINNLDAIRTELEGEGIRAVFGTLPPSDIYPAETIAMNAQITEWASINSAFVIDYWPEIADSDGHYEPGFSPDGIHPSPEASRIMAEAATDWLKANPLP